MTGIAWNTKITEPVPTMEQFFTDPKLKGKVGMLHELADSVGLTMLGNGNDPSKVTPETFDSAVKTIKGAVDSGQIQEFYGQGLPEPLPRASSLPPSPGRATSASSRRTTRISVGHPRDGRDDLDGQHVHPDRRERADGVDLHELRLRPDVAAQLALGARTSRRFRREGGGTKIDPEAAANPTSSRRGDALEGPPVRLGGAERRREITTWQRVTGK